MKYKWIVIANSACTEIYTADEKGSKESIKLTQRFVHPESRSKNLDLVTDGPGHYHARAFGRGAYENHTDAKTVEVEKFAREVAEFLEKERNQNSYKTLILISAPHFYGLLKQHFNHSLSSLIEKAIEKEIILNHKHEVEAYIYKVLHPLKFNK